MKVIWKRPDGFHEAAPSDYSVVEVSENSRIWLHKKDKENYPFRVSGGWADEDASQKLNHLVNLIPKSSKEWVSYLTELFNHSSTDSPENFLKKEMEWLDELGKNLKGDTWELEIMSETLKTLKHRFEKYTQEFLKNL
jgi:hypothetical protein